MNTMYIKYKKYIFSLDPYMESNLLTFIYFNVTEKT